MRRIESDGEILKAQAYQEILLAFKVMFQVGDAARIRRMEHHTDVGGFFTLGFEFTDIETAGISTRFFASFETVAPLVSFEWSMSSGTSRTDIVNGDRITQFEHESVQAPALPGVGTFFMRGAQFEIPKGWKMVWKTLALKWRGSGPCSAL